MVDPHPSRRARQLARRLRRERLAGVLVVVLGIVVAVVAVIALRDPHGGGDASPATTRSASPSPTVSGSATASGSRSPSRSAAPSTSSTSAAAAAKLPLVVLNNTTTSGLAAQAAQRFESGGWTVTNYGNYSNDILSTCAYYDPSAAGAQAAAEALRAQFPQIKRVTEKFDGLPAGPVVVVLTPDYTG